jgi:hypothetical protein
VLGLNVADQFAGVAGGPVNQNLCCQRMSPKMLRGRRRAKIPYSLLAIVGPSFFSKRLTIPKRQRLTQTGKLRVMSVLNLLRKTERLSAVFGSAATGNPI